MGGGFVENDYRRRLKQQPGDGQPLSFAAGKPVAAFADDRIQSLRQRFYQRRELGCFQCSVQLGIADAGFAYSKFARMVS